MKPQDWLGRWEEGHIGFHREEVHARLQSLWPVLGIGAGTVVLVPLCGKTLDMRWLVAAGHQVVGVELSERAAVEFFDEWGVEPTRQVQGPFVELSGAGVRILVGDFFDLGPGHTGPVAAVYDRAALVALDSPMRARYVEHLFALLPRVCRGLLITLEYPAGEMSGPPFSVGEIEVRELLAPIAELSCMEETDLRGEEPVLGAQVSRLQEQAFVWSRT